MERFPFCLGHNYMCFMREAFVGGYISYRGSDGHENQARFAGLREGS